MKVTQDCQSLRCIQSIFVNGYYCTNNSKKDYNLAKDGSFGMVDGGQHGQTDRKDQPFFAIRQFYGFP